MPHAEIAELAGKRSRWVDDAFGRRDREGGKTLPLLERDAVDILAAIGRLNWRNATWKPRRFTSIGKLMRERSELSKDFAAINAEVHFHKRAREEKERADDAVPFLIMDNAVDDFADALLRYLKHCGIEQRPRRQVIVDFFTRTPTTKADPLLTYMQACGLRFAFAASSRVRKRNIQIPTDREDGAIDPRIRFAYAVALFETWRITRRGRSKARNDRIR